uniref:Uncharacterized protein n=1 Tax=Medicago truncatula TaxID=3880 RepID=I3SVW7_MEDTR|nr:unknown [Medicago truncatula]
MHFMVIVSNSFTLSCLEQRNLGGHQPAKQKPKPPLISKWEDKLSLPIQTPCVPMIIFSGGNVFYKQPLFECCLCMLVEPGFVPPSYTVYLIPLLLGLFFRSIPPCHAHSSCWRINHSFNEVGNLLIIILVPISGSKRISICLRNIFQGANNRFIG